MPPGAAPARPPHGAQDSPLCGKAGWEACGEGRSRYRKRPINLRKRTVQNTWNEAVDGSKPDAKACPVLSNVSKGWKAKTHPERQIKELAGEVPKRF